MHREYKIAIADYTIVFNRISSDVCHESFGISANGTIFNHPEEGAYGEGKSCAGRHRGMLRLRMRTIPY